MFHYHIKIYVDSFHHRNRAVHSPQQLFYTALCPVRDHTKLHQVRASHGRATIAWKSGSSDSRCTPCEIPTLQQSGVVSRDDCTVAVGPHSRRSQCTDAAAIASEPNPDARAHSTVDKTDYRLLAWRSPPNGDRRCPSHLSHHVRSNVRGTSLYSNLRLPVRRFASRQKTPKS